MLFIASIQILIIIMMTLKFTRTFESHTHSGYSDGVYQDDAFIAKLKSIAEVHKLPLKLIALTDHDTLNGYEPTVRALERCRFPSGRQSLKLLPGIEFTCSFNSRETHILGYFPSFSSDRFNRILKPVAERIIKWNEGRLLSVKLLAGILEEQFNILGIPFDLDLNWAEKEANEDYRIESKKEFAGKADDEIKWKSNVSRGFLRKAIERQIGIPQTALQIYTIRNHSAENHKKGLGKYYLENYKRNRDLIDSIVDESVGILLYNNMESSSPVSIEEAVETIIRAGGAPVFAHPGETLIGAEDVSNEIVVAECFNVMDSLIEKGLKGIEVFYPSHSEEQTKLFSNYAQERGLVLCGGSDWHGKSELQHSRIGAYTPNNMFEELFKRI